MPEGADEAGDAGGHRGDEDVAVLHVGELVGQHALELPAVEDAQDALGDGHGGVLRVAPGGEGVGVSEGMRKMRGMGIPCFFVSRSTMSWTSGSSSRVTGLAPLVASAIRSENQYMTKFMTSPMAPKSTMPWAPPIMFPPMASTAMSPAMRTKVLR